MTLIMSNGGAINLLTLMLQTTLAVDEPFTLHLFNNNVTPSSSSVTSDFTETNFSGYSSVSLSRSSWTTPIIASGSAVTQYTNSPQSWTCTGSGDTVYGAYVLDNNGNLVWAELFDTPKTLSNGDVLQYTPVYSLSNA